MIPMRIRSLLASVVLGVTLIGTAGCGSFELEPWVNPYERNNLADPIMAPNRSPISTAYMDHVYQAREGARGAEGSSGGGCGCN